MIGVAVMIWRWEILRSSRGESKGAQKEFTEIESTKERNHLPAGAEN